METSGQRFETIDEEVDVIVLAEVVIEHHEVVDLVVAEDHRFVSR